MRVLSSQEDWVELEVEESLLRLDRCLDRYVQRAAWHPRGTGKDLHGELWEAATGDVFRLSRPLDIPEEEWTVEPWV